jgi:hypothetical protein
MFSFATVRRTTLPADSITARYLGELVHPIYPLPESYPAKIRFAGRYLSRPVFLEAQELNGLERDLSLVRSALKTLPQNLYNGDLQTFARAVGMSEPQTKCVMRSIGPSPRTLTDMARADLYKAATGFQLLEWNFGSSIGGVECVEMCRALLAAPEMAAFLAEEGLVYADTYEAMLETLRSEIGYATGADPIVALVEVPEGFAGVEAKLNEKAARWTDHGLRTVVGHLGEITRTNNRLWLRGLPIDVVFRMCTSDGMLLHLHDGLLEPLLAAAERGEVVIFTPLDAELYGSKGALALLSDPNGQIGLAPEERGACARLLPWTRPVHAGEAVVEDGSVVDLPAYVLEHQDELVLKPSFSHGGRGVTVGADPDITPTIWRDRLAEAMNESYVVQRLVRPVPELFPSATLGHPAAWTVAWGVFTMRQGYAGVVARAVPADARDSVVNFSKAEALVGCGFHVPA